MRKSNILPIILGILAILGILWQGVVFASCGGSWFSSNCSTSPYIITGDAIQQGYDATKKSVSGAITDKPISEFAQDIVTYLLTFVSLIGVIYIIYAGAQLMLGAGDEEKLKKTRQIILYVVLGIIIIWLSFPIINWTIKLLAYEWPPLFSQTYASYVDSDSDTFSDYKEKIKEGVNAMESELLLNKSINVSTAQNIKSLIQWGFDRLPDNREAASINREAKQIVDTYLDLAIKNPTNTNHIGNAISRVNNFLEKASISRITWNIAAGPSEWNAPLSVSFRATDITDPSGTTPSDNNYIWWMRENGGYRRELSRWSSMLYTFRKEWIYTVFLDVISWSRNSKGKIDVLPLSVSKQITVKPKLGEIVLLINGVNVSNMNTLKISPAIWNMGVILDASASRAVGNGTIAETKWEFGNGEESNNIWWPIVERQIYANQWSYILKLEMKTNDGQIFTKELQLLVRDPSATIKLDQETGFIDEDISMSATSYLTDTKNVEYTWRIQNADTNNSKIAATGEWINFKHKFDTVWSYIVSLTAKSPNGNSDTDSKIITIESREPVVSIDNPRPYTNEKPNTIIFDASKSYDPDSNSRKNLTFSWKIDDKSVTLDNIENDGSQWTYTFDGKWIHKISVTVANAYGKVKTVESQFEVTSILAVNMFVNPRVAVRGTPVSIIGLSWNAEFFEWDMWDGSPAISGTDRAIQHTYKQSWTYTITLNVTRDSWTETNSITRKVYVSDSDTPFAMIDTTNDSNSIIEQKWICESNDALIINRSDLTTFNGANSINVDGLTSGLTYTWKYFWKARTTPSISEKFNELGCFPIELNVRSTKNGASHTSIQYIKIENQPPELTNITYTIDSSKKDSQKVLVKVQANGAVDPDWVITSYIWYYKTETDPEPQNIQITQKSEITFILPNITEKYYFWVIIEDNDGAKINSLETWQWQSPLVIDNSNGNIYLPLITLTLPKNIFDVWEKVWFTSSVKTIIPGVNITNKVEYAWDFDGDGRIDKKSSSPSIEHTYSRSGDYNMKLRVTNNGVSNSKYQIIHVRNKLKADVFGYRLPDGRLYFINASEWSYDKAHWEVGWITSESLTSFMLDAGSGNTTSGVLTVSSNDSDTSIKNIDFSKIETISWSWILYQSYPRSVDDVITVKSPSDSVLLSMLGNNASNYAIDTDIMIDTSLDGTTDNDQDNRDDSSYIDGSIYKFYDLGNDNKRERKIRLALIKDGAIVATRNITIILDYITNTAEENVDLLADGTATLSTRDRSKLEELSKMIRELTDSDRIILMQRYNTLIENWNNPFDKAKSLIDIQEGVESGNMDNDKKVKISKIIDELLIGDAQVTDEVGIAAILIRDLIPKESPNHDVLLEKLTEIESHPTLLDANKKLGKEMLVLIETDGTIPDKYKWHIKNQLLVIINGGSASITTNSGSETKEEVTSTWWGWILGFISGFIKVFFIIIAIILFIWILGFIFYRITRKGDSIWFQDFLIDSVFHSKSVPPPISEDIKTNSSIINWAPPLPKEDPLINYVPPSDTKAVTDVPSITIGKSTPIVSTETYNKTEIDVTPIPEDTHTSTESIPDWLKVPGTSSESINPIEQSEIHDDIQSQDIQNNTINTGADIIPITEEKIVSTGIIPNRLDTPTGIIIPSVPSTENPEWEIINIPQNEPVWIPEDSKIDDDIPEWIKNTSVIPSEPVISTPDTTNTPKEDKLPDWLLSSIQSDTDTIKETEEELAIIPEPISESINLLDLDKKEEKIPKKVVKKPKVSTITKEKTTITKEKKSQWEWKVETKKEAQWTDTNNLPSWLK